MNFITWNKSFSVNVKLIDAQHKKLFELINDVYAVLRGEEKKEVVTLDVIIHKLLAYIDFHFKTEEKYFHEFGYKRTEEHEVQHKFYEDKTKDLYKRYMEGKELDIDIRNEILRFIKEWIMDHIKISDKQYTECFNEYGLV